MYMHVHYYILSMLQKQPSCRTYLHVQLYTATQQGMNTHWQCWHSVGWAVPGYSITIVLETTQSMWHVKAARRRKQHVLSCSLITLSRILSCSIHGPLRLLTDRETTLLCMYLGHPSIKSYTCKRLGCVGCSTSPSPSLSKEGSYANNVSIVIQHEQVKDTHIHVYIHSPSNSAPFCEAHALHACTMCCYH